MRVLCYDIWWNIFVLISVVQVFLFIICLPLTQWEMVRRLKVLHVEHYLSIIFDDPPVEKPVIKELYNPYVLAPVLAQAQLTRCFWDHSYEKWYIKVAKLIRKTAIRFNPFPWCLRQAKRSPWFFYGLFIKLWDWVGLPVWWGLLILLTLSLLQCFHYVYETIPKKPQFVTAYERRRRFREDKKWVEENHEQSKLMNFVKADAIANYRVRRSGRASHSHSS